jgi:rare lipoprotein A
MPKPTSLKVRNSVFTTLVLSSIAWAAPAKAEEAFVQCGKASWYNLRGTTANGEQADPNKLAAAHPSLPFGTLATVTNLKNGKSVVVRINDRGPFVKRRIIDVTQAAAQKLGFVQQGIARVKVTSAAPLAGKNTPDNCQ